MEQQPRTGRAVSPFLRQQTALEREKAQHLRALKTLKKAEELGREISEREKIKRRPQSKEMERNKGCHEGSQLEVQSTCGGGLSSETHREVQIEP
ncbi:unnamed protein product [Gulo gulo]|uniref:Uncharacterized protein n=1 Tax=Gulo gulo TaxID=48420 RepID=A0A9X9Q0B0_GULGU|nr:unnamed protein product [Gulo gulo]